ncbi:MAG: 2-hydroxychromene-2-carboxylate isomerase [Myxococcota bacterium]|nr:2-hydroxychromene-2-carboxylate isomerase [Myxococcota bacterium]
MSKPVLEIYWDFSSPFAYLGSTQAEAVAARNNAELIWRPMLLGGVFKSLDRGPVPLMEFSEAKRRHYMQDMLRWAAYWNVPFNFPSRFPMMTVKPMRAWLALPEDKRLDFMRRTFHAYWAEDRDISDVAVLRELLGADGDATLAKIDTPEIKQALMDATQRAVDAGVFGAPSWVVNGRQLFWGQDRIPLVEAALRGELTI